MAHSILVFCFSFTFMVYFKKFVISHMPGGGKRCLA